MRGQLPADKFSTDHLYRMKGYDSPPPPPTCPHDSLGPRKVELMGRWRGRGGVFVAVDDLDKMLATRYNLRGILCRVHLLLIIYVS